MLGQRRRWWLPAVCTLVLVLAGPRTAAARIKLSTLPVRERVEIQLENPGATLVEEERIVTLLQGSNHVDFAWSNTAIDKGTILFRVVDMPLRPAAEGDPASLVRPDGQVERVRVVNVSYPPGENALVWDDQVLVERWVDGREVVVGLLDGRVLGAIEVVNSPGGCFTETALTDDTAFHFPARLSPTRYRCVLTLAERANRVLGCVGASRVDLLVTEGENEYVLEVDSLPVMTASALLPRIAAGAGFDFPRLVERVLESSRLHSSAAMRADIVFGHESTEELEEVAAYQAPLLKVARSR